MAEQTQPEATLSLTDEIQLSSDDFNINKALTNNLVGYTLNGVQHTGTLKKTANKGYTKTGGTIYSVTDNGLELLFDEDGNCLTSGYESVTLKNASASLPTFSGNKVLTRAGKETATINAIRPIDSFAESIIIGILQHLANPQEMSDADILKWCDVAYRWAQGMFAIASTYRTANDSGDSKTVTSAIDNLKNVLYNSDDENSLGKTLIKINGFMENIYKSLTENGKSSSTSASIAVALDKLASNVSTLNSTISNKKITETLNVSGSVNSTVSGSVNAKVSGSITETSGSSDANS